MTLLGVLAVLLGLVVALTLAAGVSLAWTVLQDRPALLARASVAEQQVAALDARLAISRVEYDTERTLWAAALEQSGRSRS